MKRRLIVLTSVLALLSLLSIGILRYLQVRYAGAIDYSVDEELFNSVSGKGACTYLGYDNNGSLTEIYNDYSVGNGEWCALADICDYIKLGFIAVEDREFYNHSGVNFLRTTYAAVNQFLHLGKRFGASTITQQVIKNVSGDNEVTLERKVNEIFRALKLEEAHTKDEILEMYLNIVPMPDNKWGVKSAAKMFFNKEPSMLSLAEAALIVGITNSPTRYNPYKNPSAALKKRNNVLYAMLDYGAISEDEYKNAKEMPIYLSGEDNTEEVSNWFVDYARSEVVKDLCHSFGISHASGSLMLSGAKVILTVNPKVQYLLEEYFADEGNLSPSFKSGLKYAMTVIGNKTGDLIGLVGNGGDKKANKILNYCNVKVTPGSVLKPLALYYTLIDKALANAATMCDDVPIYFNNTNSGIIAYPKNSPDVYDGSVTLSDAIAYSKNTVAVSTYNQLGLNFVYNTLKTSYGFPLTDNDKYPSPLALGQLTDGVTLVELTRAYAAFANYGIIRDARCYISVIDKDGKILLNNNQNEKRIMKESTAKIMTGLLTGVTKRGTARMVGKLCDFDVAGKTGTSGGDLDRLFVGYTPAYTMGIWAGYQDGYTEVGSNNPSHLAIWSGIANRLYSAKDAPGSNAFDYTGLIRLAFLADGSPCMEDATEGIVGYFTPDNIPPWYYENKGEYLPA